MAAPWAGQGRPRHRIACEARNIRHTGSVLQWKRKFGWIKPDVELEHPEAFKNNWRVYVNVVDVRGQTLYSGARVSFYIYSDGKGLGAEEVFLEPRRAQEGRRGCWAGKGARPNFPQHPSKVPVQKTFQKDCGKKGGKKGLGLNVKVNEGKQHVAAEQEAEPDTAQTDGPVGPDRRKRTEEGSAGRLSWCSSEMRGWRPAMEDASCVCLNLEDRLANFALFGIFDGHGGSVVSGRAAQELPNGIQAAALECMPDAEDPTSLPVMAMSEALFELDKALRSDGQGEQGFLQLTGGKAVESSVRNAFGLMGSTAVMAMIECDGAPQLGPPTRIVVANLGDSRAIVCRGGEAIPLSEDHKPEAPTERERIEKAGGCVRRVGPCYRIDGWGLNLSRALGDFHYKAREDLLPSEQKVSVKPDCHYLEVSENDEFLFLGCDGVFELYSSEEAVESIRSRLQEGKPVAQ
ncbi:unnamed protein product [Symbiodinium sp. KB8]|nr:unnamed protein product [Symbiodinium sp. KB8]